MRTQFHARSKRKLQSRYVEKGSKNRLVTSQISTTDRTHALVPVTGVLGYACLGTCVFRLTSLFAWMRDSSIAGTQASPATRIGESAFQRTRTEVQGAVSVFYTHIPTHKHTHTRERQGSAFGVPANGREVEARGREESMAMLIDW